MAQRGQQRSTPLVAASKQLQQILSGVASLLATSWLAGRMRPLLGLENPPKRRYIKHTRWRHSRDGSLAYLCLTDEELSLAPIEKEPEPADYVLYLMYNLTSLQSLEYARKFLRVAQQGKNRPDDIVLQNVFGYDLPWRSMRHAVFRYNVMYLLLRLRSCERAKREAVAKRKQVKALREATSQVPSGLSKLKPGLLPAAVPSSPLSPALGYRVVTVVTTAALPWLTGTSINPLLRAAYLERLEHVKVNLMIPWLEAPDQRIVYPRDLVFPTPAAQEQHIRDWLLTRLNLDVHFRIVFYPARFDLEKYSIFPAGGFDLTALIPPAEADVAVLEEPEHLCWYHFGPKWRQVFRHVVGIIHTNYYEYVRRQPVDKGGGPVLAFLLWFVNVWRTRANCHLAIRLSEGVQYYADATVCNVHGVGPQFLTVHRHLRPPHRSTNGLAQNPAIPEATTGSGARTSESRQDSAGPASDPAGTPSDVAGTASVSARSLCNFAGTAFDSAATASKPAGPVPQSAGTTPRKVSEHVRNEGNGTGSKSSEALAAEPGGLSAAADVDRSADDVTQNGFPGRPADEEQEGDDQPLVFDKGCYFIGKMLWAKGYRELCDLLLDHCKQQRGKDPEPPVAKKRRFLKLPFRLRRPETKSRGGTGLYRKGQKIGVEAMEHSIGAGLLITQGGVNTVNPVAELSRNSVTALESSGLSGRPCQEESGMSRTQGDVGRGGGDVAATAADVSRERGDLSRRGGDVSGRGSDVIGRRPDDRREGGDVSRRGADTSIRENGVRKEEGEKEVEDLRAFVKPYDSDTSDGSDSPLSRARTDPGTRRLETVGQNSRLKQNGHDDVMDWSRSRGRRYSLKVRDSEERAAAAGAVASTHGRGKLGSRAAKKTSGGYQVGNGVSGPLIRPWVLDDGSNGLADVSSGGVNAPKSADVNTGVNTPGRVGVIMHKNAGVYTFARAGEKTYRNAGVYTRGTVGVNRLQNGSVNTHENAGVNILRGGSVYAPQSSGLNGVEGKSADARKVGIPAAHGNGIEADSPLKVRLSVEPAVSPRGPETERRNGLIAHETEGAAHDVGAQGNGPEEADVAVTSAGVSGLAAEEAAQVNGIDAREIEGPEQDVRGRVNGPEEAEVAVTSADVIGLNAGEAGRGPVVQVDCYGTGGEEDEIIGFARENELPVVFHGRRDHADASLWGYKVFVNPSCSDVLCTTTAEALAMGKFVVVADHPSNIFFAEHFPENTVLYNPDVPVEFSQAIQRALASHPAPLTSAQRRMLTWEAATERFMRAAQLL